VALRPILLHALRHGFPLLGRPDTLPSRTLAGRRVFKDGRRAPFLSLVAGGPPKKLCESLPLSTNLREACDGSETGEAVQLLAI